MIHQQLHKNAVGLDRIKHRHLKLDTTTRDLRAVLGLNAFFIAVSEFADASRDYPVVWVNAGKGDGGAAQVAPIAVFGLKAGQNLCVQGERWRTRHVPIGLRLYPFALARVDAQQMVVAIDESWPGLQPERGEPLFDAQGEPTAFTQDLQKQLEGFEQDVERTRLAGDMLLQKGLLREMRFDATLPSGEKLAVDGFLTVDEAKLSALSDADVVTMQRNGLLGLIHAHQVSLGNMTKLVEWHLEAAAAATSPATAAA